MRCSSTKQVVFWKLCVVLQQSRLTCICWLLLSVALLPRSPGFLGSCDAGSLTRRTSVPTSLLADLPPVTFCMYRGLSFPPASR